jgi:hypothetical protein
MKFLLFSSPFKKVRGADVLCGVLQTWLISEQQKRLVSVSGYLATFIEDMKKIETYLAT